jgi:hypothetical protein
MDVVAERTVRPVDKLDDTEPLVDGVEQGAVAQLALAHVLLARTPFADDLDEADDGFEQGDRFIVE